MTETITESFCERCGTRYSLGRSAKRRGAGIGRVRVLGRGLRNYVVNDGLPMTEAMAAARDEEDRAGTSSQLDVFHKTFNFCMTCRQYTCANCWNEKAGECLTCAPDLSREVLPAPFPDLPAAGPVPIVAATEATAPANAEPFAWPRADLDRESLVIEEPREDFPDAVAEPVEAVDEIDLLARLDAAAPPPAAAAETVAQPEPPAELDAAAPPPAAAAETVAQPEPPAELVATEPAAEPAVVAEPAAEPVAAEPAAAPQPTEEELTATELAEIEVALAATRPLTESEAVPVEAEAVPVEPEAPVAEPAVAEAEPAEISAPVEATEPAPEASAPAVTTTEPTEAASIDAPPEAGAQPAQPVDQIDVGRGQTRNLLRRFRPARPVAPPSAASPDATSAPTTAPAPEVVPPPAIAPRSAVAAVELAAVDGIGDAAEPMAAIPTEPEPVAAAEPAAEPEPAPEPVIAAAEPASEPEPALPVAAAEPAAEPEPTPEPVVAAEPASEPEPAEPAAEPEPAPEPVAASPARTDTIEQPTWRILAPEPGESVPPRWPDAPAWPANASRGAPAPADASPWAARLATARPETSGIWAASSQQVLGTPGAADPRPGTPAVQSCVSCGLSLSANARFCRRCGTRQG